LEPKTVTQAFTKKDDKKYSVIFSNTASKDDQLVTQVYAMRDAFKKLFGVDLDTVKNMSISITVD
jgi:hypothetical protein